MKSPTSSFNTGDRAAAVQAPVSNSKVVHTWLAYTGAFLFSVALLILVHEFGHFMAFHWRGHQAVRIRINPFMGVTSSAQETMARDAPWIIIGGTVFNLSVAALAAGAQRLTRGIFRGLLKTYAASAFLIEGMVILAGLFFQETVTDFSWLAYFGWSRLAVAGLGAAFSLIAGYLLFDLWHFLGARASGARKTLLVLILPNLLYGLLSLALLQVLLPIDPGFFKRFAAVNLVLQTVYLVGLAWISPWVLSRMQNGGAGFKASRRGALVCMLLGCAAWAASFMVLN
jgi:hypothetical protein